MKRITFFSLGLVLAAAVTALSQTKKTTPTPQLENIVREAAEKATRQVLAEDAQRKFSTDAGHAYVLKFLQSISKDVVDAMRACDTREFKSAAADNIIFVISAEGHIDLLFHDTGNSYAQCIAQHLHLPKTVPKPPGKSWPGSEFERCRDIARFRI
jgi:hypothetical protein